MSFSIRSEAKKRILLDMLAKTHKKDKSWKILVLDRYSIRVLNYVVTVEEIKNHGVTLIENLHQKKQPFPKYSGIYFIEPSTTSIQQLIDDFSKKRKNFKKFLQYKQVHLFFTSRVGQTKLDMIKKSVLVKKKMIKTFCELNFNFYNIERNVFSMEMQSDFKDFFVRDKGFQLKKFMKQISSVFQTTRTLPSIRYYKNSAVCKKIAEELFGHLKNDKVLNKMVNRDKEKCVRSEYPRSLVLIVDRTIDMFAPLLHEFTYQHMLYDLYDVDTDNKVYQNIRKKSGKVRAILNEMDVVWQRFKYNHFSGLSKSVKKAVSEYKEQNRDVEKYQRGIKDEKTISSVLRELPNYLKTTKFYSTHVELLTQIQGYMKKKSLYRIAEVEQNLVMKEMYNAETGKYVKYDSSMALSDVNKIVSQDGVSDQCKLRLLLLLIMTYGVKSKQKEDLFINADVDDDDREIFQNYEKYFKKKPKFSLSSKVVKKKIKGFFKKFNLLGGDDEEEGTDAIVVSRYVTQMYKIAKQCVKNKLPVKDFPYVDDETIDDFKLRSEDKEDSDDEDTPIDDGKKRRPKAKWAMKKKVEEKKVSRDRLFIFCVGGITYSEIRDCAKLSEIYKVDVSVGGSSVLNSERFLDKLSNMEV